jgi:hypothetical protein
MIYPAKYNGINFSYDFTRKSNRLSFDLQRQKNVLPSQDLEYLFFEDDSNTGNTLTVHDVTLNKTYNEPPLSVTPVGSRYLVVYMIHAANLNVNSDVYFSVSSTNSDSTISTIYSELYTIRDGDYFEAYSIHKVTAYNNDNRHGYLNSQTPAFGYFIIDGYWTDIFANNKVEYEYSYKRKMLLSSENQIIKQLTFLDLTMYNQNILKWLCNCENLFIDGVQYNLISDFTELAKDDYNETCSLKADFVEANQSFFAQPSTRPPMDVFPNQFFVTNEAPFVPFNSLLDNVSMSIDENNGLIYTTPDNYNGMQANSTDGDLIMTAPNGYEGMNLNIEEGNLIVND